jgi:hypothetical protein
MRTIAIVLVCLLIVTVAASSAFAGGKQKPGVSYVVSNPNHTQTLGGKSTHAERGLHVAAARSGRVDVHKGGMEGGGSFDSSPAGGK